METVEPSIVTDAEIVDFLREVALEGYDTDEDIVRDVTGALVRERPGVPDLPARVQRLAAPLFDGLHAAEAGWPIPTDNDRLDRAFATLEAEGIHALQDWYQSQVPADEEMRHEIKFAKYADRSYRGFAFFHGGDTRRAMAGEGLRLTWGAVVKGNVGKARKERAAWEIAQDIHRALWEQGLSPSWSQVVGDPITLPFTWRRRRKRHPPPPEPARPPSPGFLRAMDAISAFAPPEDLLEMMERIRMRHRLRLVKTDAPAGRDGPPKKP